MSLGGTVSLGLLELQRGTAAQRLPLVCVHPAGGNVLAYLPLARALGPEQTVYALQSVGLDDDTAPLERVTDMTSRYLAELDAAVPEGPCVLLGWSFGGLVAYEMARELRRAGREVARVVLLDTAVPRPEDAEELPQDDAYWLADVAAFLAAMEGLEPPLSLEDLRGLQPDEQMERFVEVLSEVGFLPPGVGAKQIRRLLRVYKSNVRASRTYAPEPYDGRVVLLRAAGDSVHRPEIAADPALGWRGLLHGRLDVEVVPGEHLPCWLTITSKAWPSACVHGFRKAPTRNRWPRRPFGRRPQKGVNSLGSLPKRLFARMACCQDGMS